MIARVADFFKSLLCKESNDGCITSCFKQHQSSLIISEIMDPLNQEKAVEFIKQAAAKKTYSNIEKAEMFNLKMLDWAEKSGSHLSDCMLNCLREMALASLKASGAKLDDGQA